MMAAGLWTTPSDLARWIIEVEHAYGGTSRVLNQATARAMLTPGLGGWGLGVEIAGAGDSLRFMHGGANEGFRGQFVGYVTGGRGVAVLTNSDAGAVLANEIIASVGHEYDWPGLRVIKEHTEVPVDPALLGEYAGKYQLSPTLVVTIARAGDHLTAQAPGQNAFPIFAEGRHAFFAKVAEIQFQFEMSAQGKATGLVLTQGTTSQRAPRVE